MTVSAHEAYPWRADPKVPEFDDQRMLVVMDGDCALCSATACRIARLDRADRTRICTVQSELGQALMRHVQFDPHDPDSWLLLADGKIHYELDAALTLFPRLSRAYTPLRALGLLPAPLQAWLYARIARNRYALFGTTDLCALPDKELRRRIVS